MVFSTRTSQTRKAICLLVLIFVLFIVFSHVEIKVDTTEEPSPTTRTPPLWEAAKYPSVVINVTEEFAKPPPVSNQNFIQHIPSTEALPHPLVKLYTFQELRALEQKHKIKQPDKEAAGSGFAWKNGTLWNNGFNLSLVDEEFDQSSHEPITFVAVVVNEADLAYNLLKSPAFTRFGEYHQWIIYNNIQSKLKVTKLYHDGWKRAKNDLLVFMHPDVWLGDSSLPFLYQRVTDITMREKWGVLGTAGFGRGPKKEDGGHDFGF
eukprot:TRINITY_DN6603_c0_g1_i1.p1 TRINITY_DN6603_c0_g1~~TRINITY_DN6603_c0_g1_i1.p1  ORF type:complete len:263 (-),score=61.55 TRINITY_DN6603_c0_g1_i1:632-1420(-)